MEEILQIIGQHEVFSALTKKELSSLTSILQEKTYAAKELVFDTHQEAIHLYFIKSGQLSLKLTNNEYKTLGVGQLFGEVAIINSDFRTGSVTALVPTELISICGERLFEEEFIPPKVALKIVRALSKRITNYLRSKEQISTKEIITQGENDYVEFKSTLRWNLYTKKKDKAIENAALKTMAAFMNSNGGILIIGVDDAGNTLGLENDQFSNHDKLLLHLTSLVKERIGVIQIKFLHFSIERINEKDLLRIDCTPAISPVYVTDGKTDHFYIRTGPSTTNLRLSKVYDYIRERFEVNS